MYSTFEAVSKPISIMKNEYWENLNMPRLHYHNAYEIYFLEHGERDYIIHDKFFKITDGDFILIAPFELHKTEGKGYRRILVTFMPDYIEKHFSEEVSRKLLSCFEKKVIRPPAEETEYLKGLLYKLLESEDEHKENIAFFYIGELLMRLSNFNVETRPPKDHKYRRITEITEYINRNFNTIEGIENIAEDFYISKFHLCRIFKAATGVSVIEYLNSIKIKNACEMLTNSDYSVTKISEKCGFGSSNYFCNLFKKSIHMTPTEYREMTAGSEQ